MNHFLTLSYYFTPIPDTDFQYSKLFFALGLLVIASGYVLQFYRKKKLKDSITKKLLRAYPGLLKTYGLIILILLLIREAAIPYLSMRFLWVVVLLCMIYSALKFVVKFKPEYNKRAKQAEKNNRTKQYLPKRKK